MGDCISKTESSSNADRTAGLHAELATLFRAICGLASELAPPSDIDSVSLTIIPAQDLNPAYANCPKTLALVLGYFWYNVYTPLFYLATVKHRVDFDGDDGESMTMPTPAPVDGSPFKEISAAELPEEIRKGLGLLLTRLRERKYELEEELISLQKWKRFWSAASSVLSVALVVINLSALVAATVPPAAAIAGVPLASVAVLNLLGASVKAVDPWLGMTADERKSELESQADAINAMREGSSSTVLLLPTLEQLRALVENLKIERVAAIEQNTMAIHDLHHAAHLEREVKERKKKVEKGIKSVRKMVDRVGRRVRKKAADFSNFIAKWGVPNVHPEFFLSHMLYRDF